MVRFKNCLFWVPNRLFRVYAFHYVHKNNLKRSKRDQIHERKVWGVCHLGAAINLYSSCTAPGYSIQNLESLQHLKGEVITTYYGPVTILLAINQVLTIGYQALVVHHHDSPSLSIILTNINYACYSTIILTNMNYACYLTILTNINIINYACYLTIH